MDLVTFDDQGACFLFGMETRPDAFSFEEIRHRCELVRSFLAWIVTQIGILAATAVASLPPFASLATGSHTNLPS